VTLQAVLSLLGFFTIVLTLFIQWQIYVTRAAATFAASSLLLGSLVFPGLPLVIEAGVVLDLLGIVVVARIIMQMRETSVEEAGERFERLKG